MKIGHLIQMLHGLEDFDLKDSGLTYEICEALDAVQVVRYKDCKHYNAGCEYLKEGYGIEYPQDWFCADGKRREGR